MAEQVARHLGAPIREERWKGRMPGRDRLAGELGVNRKTVERALVRLEERGVLASGGAGRRREIIEGRGMTPRSAENLRVKILAYETEDLGRGFFVDLQRRLGQLGHEVDFSRKTMISMGMDPERIAKHVASEEADSWVVISGPRGVLEWFAQQSVPTFALFGRRHGLPIAGVGPDKSPVLRGLVVRLTGLGHRRIVLLSRKERRLPSPGLLERNFLEALEAHGIETGAYHLPDWDETPAGLRDRLDAMFKLTPPTALILDEAFFLQVAQMHLARRGIFAPQDISIVCQDSDPSFGWHFPSIAHIHWPSEPIVRRVVQWVKHLAHGRKDVRQSFTKSVFVEGGTIGPPGD